MHRAPTEKKWAVLPDSSGSQDEIIDASGLFRKQSNGQCYSQFHLEERRGIKQIGLFTRINGVYLLGCFMAQVTNVLSCTSEKYYLIFQAKN